MASYHHFNSHPQYPTPPASVSHTSHHGRSRRAPRLSVSHNTHKQFRGMRSIKDLSESVAISNYRQKFELMRSFDLEDDLEFCPNLLTESDMMSVNSGTSERSSLASNSPTSSPKELAQRPTPSFSLNSSSNAFVPPPYLSLQSNLKLHQPAATRTRNAIPIINPTTGITMASPPPSVSPGARLQHVVGRRW